MAVKFFEVQHNTEAWRNWRAGKVTCSNFLSVMSVGTGKPWGTPALRYADQIAVEIITGQPLSEEIDSAATNWGKQWEPTAREEYTLATGHHVVKPNRVYVKDGMFVGGSPDGMVGEPGGIEIKCPKDMRVHFETVAQRQIPLHHIPQVQGYMWLTERDWWDFVSFDPRFPEASRLFVQRIPRNNDYILQLGTRVRAFQDLVLHKLKRFGYEGDPFAIAPPVAEDQPTVEG